MKRKTIALLVVLTLALSLASCSGGEETTLTGMVASVDGTVISLVEMNRNNMGDKGFGQGQPPEKPEGDSERPQGFENFNPEAFEGSRPEGDKFPQWENGEMPENFTMPEDFTRPEGGGDKGPGFENFLSDAETKKVDIANAHISVEFDGGKETGSMDNIKPGTFVTVTMDKNGKATNVLVSSQTGFGGGRKPSN